jgi:hypothetical protein
MEKNKRREWRGVKKKNEKMSISLKYLYTNELGDQVKVPS